MKKLLLALILPGMANLYCAESRTSSLCKPEESAIMEFQTRGKKQLGLCSGGSGTNEYLVYRFGTPARIELEYPGDHDSSFSKFSFRSYLRGGGAGNEGLDANYIAFQNGGSQYEIFEERSATDPEPNIGIRVKTSKSKKDIVLKAIPGSVKGTLTPLREEDRLILAN